MSDDKDGWQWVNKNTCTHETGWSIGSHLLFYYYLAKPGYESIFVFPAVFISSPQADFAMMRLLNATWDNESPVSDEDFDLMLRILNSGFRFRGLKLSLIDFRVPGTYEDYRDVLNMYADIRTSKSLDLEPYDKICSNDDTDDQKRAQVYNEVTKIFLDSMTSG